MKQKIVCHHAHISNPERCFVRLFKRYREICPADAPPHAVPSATAVTNSNMLVQQSTTWTQPFGKDSSTS